VEGNVTRAVCRLQITLDDYVALVHAANPDIVEALFETCAPFATNKQQVKASMPDIHLQPFVVSGA
jgi:hypothetical protein